MHSSLTTQAVSSQSSKRQKLLATAQKTAYLLQSDVLTPSESKELDALLGPDDPPAGSGDTYNDHGQCSPEHTQWKHSMNGVFLTLLRRFHHRSPTGTPLHVVYLDGPQMGTTRALRAGTHPQTTASLPEHPPLVLYVANDAPATADIIQASGLVDHVSHSAFNEALTSEWRDVPFAGAYVDLCTGTVATLLATLQHLFTSDRPRMHPFVLGYTLTARDPHGQPMDVRVLAVRKWLHAHPRFTGPSDGPSRIQEAEILLPEVAADRWSHQGTRTRFVVLG
jgi:hypothetical protein